MRIAPWGLAGILAWLVGAWPTAVAIAGNPAPPPPPPLLGLDLGRCPEVPSGDVQNLVGVELHRPVVLLDDAAGAHDAPPATTTVRVTCEGLRAAIAIRDPLTGKTVERMVDLAAAAPVARPHLLALSIVELLAASWMELQNNRAPTLPPENAAATPDAREAALDLVSRRPGAQRLVRLFAAAAAQASTANLTSWGGAVVVGGDPIPHLGWLVDLAFQHGERMFTLGRVTVDTVSGLGALLARVSWDRLALRAGLGIRGGGAWLSGTPANPPTVGGAVQGNWWGPVALVDSSLIVRGRVVLGLTIETGRVILPVIATVQGAEPVAIDGNWIRGTLGVGFTL